MATHRPYDICVFGATGFTGIRVLHYALRVAGRGRETPLRIAAAGRNEAKVRAAMLRHFGQEFNVAEIPIVVADVIDLASLVSMCSRTRVLINCVGPFGLYGEPVVSACVQTGCDYVDITGEPLFMDRMFVKYHRAAKEADALIVPACGFDCIPNDVGVEFTRQQFPDPSLVSSIESFFTMKFGPQGMVGNYATYESLVDGFSNVAELARVRKQMNRPKLTYVGPTLRRREGLFFEPRVGGHCAPFPSADATAVRNSQYLLAEEPAGGPPGKPVQFAAYCIFPSRFHSWLYALFGLVLKVLVKSEVGRNLLKTYGEFFSFGYFSRKGATDKQIAEASFSITFYASGYKQPPASNDQKPGQHGGPMTDVQIVTRVSGPEVGYVTTPIAVVESALTILDERPKLPLRGVLTPAAAFRRSTLTDRLHANGVQFNVVSKSA